MLCQYWKRSKRWIKNTILLFRRLLNWQRNMEIRKVRDFIASGICTITIVHCMLWSINWIFMMLRMKDSPEAEDTDTNTSADLFHCLRSGICTGSDL